MRVNPALPHRDYNFAESEPQSPEVIRCAGYLNPRVEADYSPRDIRPFLTACRDRNCPADRCLDMPEDSDAHQEVLRARAATRRGAQMETARARRRVRGAR